MGGFTGVNVPLKQYFSFAYDRRSDLVFGLDWIGSDRFDIAAKTQDAVPPDRLRAMMRNLLEERFHLVAHRETREVPVYALTVGKDGQKHFGLHRADGAKHSPRIF